AVLSIDADACAIGVARAVEVDHATVAKHIVRPDSNTHIAFYIVVADSVVTIEVFALFGKYFGERARAGPCRIGCSPTDSALDSDISNASHVVHGCANHSRRWIR